MLRSLLASLVVLAVLAGCATHPTAGRIHFSAAKAEEQLPVNRFHNHEGYHSYSRTEDLVGFLAMAAVVGAACAYVYFERFSAGDGDAPVRKKPRNEH